MSAIFMQIGEGWVVSCVDLVWNDPFEKQLALQA
jgi:hypothetical protein